MILTALDYDEMERLRELLALAEAGAGTPGEDRFVANMQDRFEAYGADTSVSEEQWRWLEDIAEKA